jgi:glycosyltransferase involved in cell wall biosynthesis
VIPARNEAGNEEILREALSAIEQSLNSSEVILVEGNSSDNTFEMLSRLADEYSGRLDIRLLRQDGRGKKNAVVCGFKGCKGDLLAIIDCDFTVDIRDSIAAIKQAALRDCCIINCSRTIYPMEKDAMRWANYIGNRVFALLVSFLSSQDVSDALCGTKIFPKTLYEKMLADGSWLSPRDPFGDFTLIFGASNNDYRILNFPVRYFARRSGAPNISRWTDGLKLLRVCWFQLIS